MELTSLKNLAKTLSSREQQDLLKLAAESIEVGLKGGQPRGQFRDDKRAR